MQTSLDSGAIVIIRARLSGLWRSKLRMFRFPAKTYPCCKSHDELVFSFKRDVVNRNNVIKELNNEQWDGVSREVCGEQPLNPLRTNLV